jgi:hypothetical protein
MQPVLPLQPPSPQIRRLILKRRIRPHQPQRQNRLHPQHHQQRPPTHQPPHNTPPHPPAKPRRDTTAHRDTAARASRDITTKSLNTAAGRRRRATPGSWDTTASRDTAKSWGTAARASRDTAAPSRGAAGARRPGAARGNLPRLRHHTDPHVVLAPTQDRSRHAKQAHQGPAGQTPAARLTGQQRHVPPRYPRREYRIRKGTDTRPQTQGKCRIIRALSTSPSLPRWHRRIGCRGGGRRMGGSPIFPSGHYPASGEPRITRAAPSHCRRC